MLSTTGNKRKMATTALPMLPEEMEMKVLLRLPVKFILRFSAVCRRWAALLSSEEFRAAWTKLAEPTTMEPAAQLLFLHMMPSSPWQAVRFTEVRSGDSRPLLTFDGVCTDSAVMAPVPCRGLTLMHDPVSGHYHVFNAATRAAAMLPHPPSFQGGRMKLRLTSTAGLGFDERTKEYKVVRLVSTDRMITAPDRFTKIRCEVYSLGRGPHHRRWRPPTSSTNADGVVVPATPAGAALVASRSSVAPVFVDGFLHWLIDPYFDNPPAGAGMYVAPVLSFSLAEETFSSRVRPVPFDWHVYQASEAAHLAELDGRLCMVRDLRSGSSDRLEIWSYGATDDGGEDVWSLVHRIDLAQHAGRDLLTEPKFIKILGVSVGKKVIFIATSKGNIVAYDPMSGTLETILQLGGGRNHGNLYDPMSESRKSLSRVSLFKESLTPVH